MTQAPETLIRTAGKGLAQSSRIQSIDILRGLVMVLMAIDHVRVYSGIPSGGQTAGIFFTRWITHFCVPAFVFFAGTGAFLHGAKLNEKGKLAAYLFTRGILLVLLELTLIRFCWTFNFDFARFTLAGVIWMLGWCMVLLSALVWLRPVVLGIIGLFIIFGQQLFSLAPKLLPASARPAFGRIWEFVYPSGLDGWQGIAVLYVLVPWIGVMAAGYGFGLIMKMNAERRKRICLFIGLPAILIFLVAGSLMAYTQPGRSDAPPFIFRLLNQRKYPASPWYLLMTLGPIIALIPYAEKAGSRFARVLQTFGRVPLFYYILHILLIHLSALAVNAIRLGNAHGEWYGTAPFTEIPQEQRWPLGLLYLVFAIDVLLLYFACRWYAAYKLRHPEKRWLSYI